MRDGRRRARRAERLWSRRLVLQRRRRRRWSRPSARRPGADPDVVADRDGGGVRTVLEGVGVGVHDVDVPRDRTVLADGDPLAAGDLGAPVKVGVGADLRPGPRCRAGRSRRRRTSRQCPPSVTRASVIPLLRATRGNASTRHPSGTVKPRRMSEAAPLGRLRHIGFSPLAHCHGRGSARWSHSGRPMPSDRQCPAGPHAAARRGTRDHQRWRLISQP